MSKAGDQQSVHLPGQDLIYIHKLERREKLSEGTVTSVPASVFGGPTDCRKMTEQEKPPSLQTQEMTSLSHLAFSVLA
jgi:hypothetical protein